MSRNLVTVALVAALTACASDPTGTVKSAALANRPTVEASRWHFGSERYRDHGSHFLRVCSGSAGVDGEVLFTHDGSTVLTLTSFRNGAPGIPAGSIDKFLLRVFDPSGRQVLTQTITFGKGSSYSNTFRGFAPGFTFQLVVQVSGIDRKRVDDVTLSPLPVVRRPDLAVTALNLPSTVIAGSPALISASVAELNGGHGATANCLLLVDHVIVDHASGIFVDAGDVVSCAFTTTIGKAGPHTVQVAVDDISPLDDNHANNLRTATLNVVLPASLVTSPSVSFNGSLQSGGFTAIDSFSTAWTDPSNHGFLYLQAHDYESQTGTTQSAMFSGVITSVLVFPLISVELNQASGGALLASSVYSAVPADNPGNADCITRGVGTGVEFYLCSDPSGFTTFTYLRATGTVTYASDQYQAVWNGTSYDITPYVANGTTTTGIFAVLGSTFTFDVRIADASGTYVATAAIPLSPFTENDLTPSSCVTGSVQVPPATYSARTCTYSSYVFTGVTGSVSGNGATTSPGTGATP
ncbi:MAG TPA: hypothetical protein VGI92_07795 [Gemmatimonadales bacterium]